MTVGAETSNLSNVSGLPNPLHRAVFERVKKCEVADVAKFITDTGIDIANLVDEVKNFTQTPIFSASILQPH